MPTITLDDGTQFTGSTMKDAQKLARKYEQQQRAAEVQRDKDRDTAYEMAWATYGRIAYLVGGHNNLYLYPADSGRYQQIIDNHVHVTVDYKQGNGTFVLCRGDVPSAFIMNSAGYVYGLRITTIEGQPEWYALGVCNGIVASHQIVRATATQLEALWQAQQSNKEAA